MCWCASVWLSLSPSPEVAVSQALLESLAPEGHAFSQLCWAVSPCPTPVTIMSRPPWPSTVPSIRSAVSAVGILPPPCAS
jgi:hypothetical protein